METLEELKALVENAYDRSTHVQTVESENQYFESNGFGFWCLNANCQVAAEDIVSVRSLSDIKRIIELMELVGDVAALGFLEVAHDSGVSHRQVCKKFKELFPNDSNEL